MIGREQWRLTEGLIFVHFAVFILGSTEPAGLAALALVPGEVAVRPWTLVTFQFIHGGMISFFFSMIVLWIMARPLEEEWGSPRFLAFWAVSVLGAAVAALLLGYPLAGDVFLSTSLLFTFATVYPGFELLVFFVLPVKVKWLAILGAALLALSSFAFGLRRGLVNLVGMSAGYLFFLATRRLPSRRKLGFELAKRRAARQVSAENASAEARNVAWDPRVRAAGERARSSDTLAAEDEALLAELEAARDVSVTVCAASDFGGVDDPVCRTCAGFPECAARSIRDASAAEPGDDRVTE